ncbi:hypothetical protein EV702DRAFT_31487 [Suillus placidus]|uniref:Uncharacterized protein n=1 Tax=Suillus placidus TaxID=48579 RepID=A0A9P7A9R9_9AGAM|nr:hypothetical protein EV702DRAFT_31487 [Suillus placidus]
MRMERCSSAAVEMLTGQELGGQERKPLAQIGVPSSGVDSKDLQCLFFSKVDLDSCLVIVAYAFNLETFCALSIYNAVVFVYAISTFYCPHNPWTKIYLPQALTVSQLMRISDCNPFRNFATLSTYCIAIILWLM